MRRLIILGIDPGTIALGYGVLEKSKAQVSFKDCGELKVSNKLPFIERIGPMSEQVAQVLKLWQPDVIVVEKIFLGRNVDSAFKLGHIRGACISQAVQLGADVKEYAPRSVKLGITGSGTATKEQVQLLLKAQLGLRSAFSSLDASDALALAFYHATSMDLRGRFGGRGVQL